MSVKGTEGLRDAALEENEALYGKEIRSTYGEEEVDKANGQLSSLRDTEFKELLDAGDTIYQGLADLFKAGSDFSDEKVLERVREHHTYLQGFGTRYTLDMYFGLGQMYIEDPRFVETFDGYAKGMASWFSKAIEFYCLKEV